jgi:hypothetical protein
MAFILDRGLAIDCYPAHGWEVPSGQLCRMECLQGVAGCDEVETLMAHGCGPGQCTWAPQGRSVGLLRDRRDHTHHVGKGRTCG